jgi:hypothetical protein
MSITQVKTTSELIGQEMKAKQQLFWGCFIVLVATARSLLITC